MIIHVFGITSDICMTIPEMGMIISALGMTIPDKGMIKYEMFCYIIAPGQCRCNVRHHSVPNSHCYDYLPGRVFML